MTVSGYDPQLGSRDFKTLSAVLEYTHPITGQNSTLASNNTETSLELDSHADTYCVGKEALVIYDYERPVTVSGYDPQLGSRDFKTVSAVLEYTHPLTGQI